MKVLFICDQAHLPGGVRVVCEQTLYSVQRIGCSVALLGRRSESSETGLEAATGAVFVLDTHSAAALGESINLAVTSSAPDVVHVISGRWPVSRKVNEIVRHVPWVLSIHNVPPQETMLPACHRNDVLHYTLRNTRFAVNSLIWKRSLRCWNYAEVVCHSAEVMGRIVNVTGEAGRVTQISLGCDPPRSTPSQLSLSCSPFRADASLKIATVAGLVHHKGLHDYVRALVRVREVFRNLHYVIVGSTRDTGYLKYLLRLIAELGLAGHVSVLCDAPDCVKAATLQTADLYVQPSHEEGFCLAFLDAAYVVPRLLGTHVGAIPSIASNDVLSRIVPPSAVAALAARTIDLGLSRRDDHALLARHNRLAHEYSWSGYGKQLVRLFDRLLSQHVSEGTDHRDKVRGGVRVSV